MVRVCASTLLPSRTGLPANLPTHSPRPGQAFDCRRSSVAAGRALAARHANASEPDRVKHIQVNRIRQNARGRTQPGYLPCFQQLNSEKRLISGEMYVSGRARQANPSEPCGVKPINISMMPQNSGERTRRAYLHYFQQLNREKGSIFRETYVSGPPPIANSAGLSIFDCRLSRQVCRVQWRGSDTRAGQRRESRRRSKRCGRYEAGMSFRINELPRMVRTESAPFRLMSLAGPVFLAAGPPAEISASQQHVGVIRV